MTSTPLEQRLARILEVNAELAGELDLDRLTARVTDHAVDYCVPSGASCSCVQSDGSLTVHTSRSRAGDEPHAEFSRSIAEDVIATRRAGRDPECARRRAHEELRLGTPADVAVGGVRAYLGALRRADRRALRRDARAPWTALPSGSCPRSLPSPTRWRSRSRRRGWSARTERRADELEVANAELEEAQERLRELLGDRTAKLKRARKRLRDARRRCSAISATRGWSVPATPCAASTR